MTTIPFQLCVCCGRWVGGRWIVGGMIRVQGEGRYLIFCKEKRPKHDSTVNLRCCNNYDFGR